MLSALVAGALVAVPGSAHSTGELSATAWNDTTLSAGFGQGGVVRLAGWTRILDTVELPDGGLLLRVQHAAYSGVTDLDGMVRLRADGSLDPSFGATGPSPGSVVVPAGTPATIFVRANGRILLTGGAVRQYLANGDLDTSFGSGGSFNLVSGPTFELDDGSLMVTILNDVSFGGLGLQHLDGNGGPIPGGLTFTYLTVNAPQAVHLSSGGWRLISAGRSGGDLSDSYARVIAPTATGVVDTTYGGGDGVAVLGAQAFGPVVMGSVMPDGRLVVGVSSADWSTAYVLARLLPNGDFDTSFGSGGLQQSPWSSFRGTLTSMAADGDGSLTLGVWYRWDHPPNPYLSTIVRTLPNGEVDQSFQPHGWTPGSVWLAELGVAGFSVGGSVTAVSGGAVVVSTTQYDPTLSAPGVAQLTRLQLPPHGQVPTVTAPADALAPAVRLRNAHRV